MNSRSITWGRTDMQKRLYLVEDSPVIRETMVEMLEDLAEVEVVAWSEAEAEAIETMRRTEWDVALVDLFLKEGSGLGVVRAFRARDKGKLLFVVTNYATAEMRRRCKELGADRTFDKSTELDQLIDALLAKL